MGYGVRVVDFLHRVDLEIVLPKPLRSVLPFAYHCYRCGTDSMRVDSDGIRLRSHVRAGPGSRIQSHMGYRSARCCFPAASLATTLNRRCMTLKPGTNELCIVTNDGTAGGTQRSSVQQSSRKRISCTRTNE